MSETSSVTSVGKGTVVSKNLAPAAGGGKSTRTSGGSSTKAAASKASIPTGGMSFSKAGKALASKYL